MSEEKLTQEQTEPVKEKKVKKSSFSLRRMLFWLTLIGSVMVIIFYFLKWLLIYPLIKEKDPPHTLMGNPIPRTFMDPPSSQPPELPPPQKDLWRDHIDRR